MIKGFRHRSILLSIALCSLLLASQAAAQVTLLAAGSLTQTHAGENVDLSGLKYSLENDAPANLLGGLGSGRDARPASRR
jgi:hypothetical protein